MGNMTDFAGAPADVGLATLPGARGRGHATALAADMLAACFVDVEVAIYRALVTNEASLAVARRLGFEGYGENVAIRLA
jgi:RimJ/RimL family protein N-acetyltransferase